MKSILTLLFSSITCMSHSAMSIDPNQSKKENTMENYTTVQKPEIFIMGIQCRTSNAPDAGPHDIAKLWGDFYAKDILNQISNKTSSEVLALK